ncbi:MAG: DUF2442 domain-containing protein [Verrucomicrobia bacterium]|nr:DUF2442 domain-containing protein [Verrucomicrobiota bacterium]
MLHEITEAVAHPDHTVTITWSDGARAQISFAPYLAKGGVFEALKDPAYFVREMRVLPGGIGLTWPNEVDFSADGLRHSAQAQSNPLDNRTGADLVAALQASPYRESEIEPERFRHETGEPPDETNEWGRYSPACKPTPEDEFWAIVLALVQQSCGIKGGDELDSWALSAYERAIIALDEAGFVEIDPECGRISAKVLPKARKFEAWMEFHDRPNRIREARHTLANVPGMKPEALARSYNITFAELMGGELAE